MNSINHIKMIYYRRYCDITKEGIICRFKWKGIQ